MNQHPHLLLIAAILLTVRITGAQDVQVSASASTDSIGTQDQFQLSVTISGKDSGDAETPRLPRLQGFQVVAGPSVSSQFQWINGRTSSTKSFSWVLLPEKEGQFTIDPVEVRVGNRTYKTQPLSIRVTPGAARTARPQPRPLDPFEEDGTRARTRATGEEVFVTAEIDRSNAYLGQQVTLSYHLYTQVGVSGIQIRESPSLTGFWVEDLEVPANPVGNRRIVNGREYLEYVIKKQAIFPNSAGKLKIPPTTFAISAKSAGDFLTIFGQTETLYRKTKEVVLEVDPLPAQGRPPDFGNAVGSFNLTSNLDKSEAATGEAVTLRVKISGRGNIKTVPDVPLPQMPDFTVFSSKRADNIRPFEGDSIGGDKSWEHVIVPKASGQQTIPSLSFSYFDPEQGKYETATAPALTLNVVRGADAGGTMTTLSGLNKQNLTRQGTDINFIKLSPADLDVASEPIYRSAWFYVLGLLALSSNLAAFFYQRERAKQEGNVVLARSRRAGRVALERMKRAEKAARTEPRRFYDETAAALGGYLADRFNLPEIEVAGDALERNLTTKSVDPATVGEILTCLQECDFGRFVSASADPKKGRELASRVRKIIHTIERG